MHDARCRSLWWIGSKRAIKKRSFNDGFSLLPGPTKTLFVKGLSEDTTDQTLKDAFEGAAAARIVTDRETGSSKG